jgi:hypothetical protein
MQHKFWFFYLAFVLLLSGVAYVAISDDTDVPLALSDSEMAVLQATGQDEKCKSHRPGCDRTTCDTTYYLGISTKPFYKKRCVSDYPGYNCTYGGTRKRDACLTTVYTDYCNNKFLTSRYTELECH